VPEHNRQHKDYSFLDLLAHRFSKDDFSLLVPIPGQVSCFLAWVLDLCAGSDPLGSSASSSQSLSLSLFCHLFSRSAPKASACRLPYHRRPARGSAARSIHTASIHFIFCLPSSCFGFEYQHFLTVACFIYVRSGRTLHFLCEAQRRQGCLSNAPFFCSDLYGFCLWCGWIVELTCPDHTLELSDQKA
jgi:hypothetical protein